MSQVQVIYRSKLDMLKGLAEHSNIDFEKTARCPGYGFVLEDGQSFNAPNWILFLKQLVEKADAKLVIAGCQKYPAAYIMLYSTGAESLTDTQEDTVVATEETTVEVVKVKKTRAKKTETTTE